MRIAIEPGASEPPFPQVRSQLATAIRAGSLPPGARLPPMRRLAGDLGLAPNTAARAYRELERDGYIETRGRHGTYVADGIPASLATLDAEIAQLAAHVRRLGIPRRTSPRCSPAPSTSLTSTRADDRSTSPAAARSRSALSCRRHDGRWETAPVDR